MNDPIIPPDDFERGQMFLIMGDYWQEIGPYVHHLYNMRRSKEIFAYLIRNKLTEKKFIEFVKVDCGNSIIKMQAILLSKIEKEKDIRPLFLKRDLKS